MPKAKDKADIRQVLSCRNVTKSCDFCLIRPPDYELTVLMVTGSMIDPVVVQSCDECTSQILQEDNGRFNARQTRLFS